MPTRPARNVQLLIDGQWRWGSSNESRSIYNPATEEEIGHFACASESDLEDASKNALVMNDEPFGPVAAVSRFSEAAEAIDEANRLPVGLAAYAYTWSSRMSRRLVQEVDYGMLSINHHGLGLAETPFGGVKDSGYGSEDGIEGMESYLRTKFVSEFP
jgi:acyl-CoA reductase-like NAD-dependent aldehyde dehydrogenase